MGILRTYSNMDLQEVLKTGNPQVSHAGQKINSLKRAEHI
jgi:hypothetical protein